MRDYFDHEKLEVYQLELAFITWVTKFVVLTKERPVNARLGEVIDQVDRAFVAKGVCSKDDIQEGKQLLVRIVSHPYQADCALRFFIPIVPDGEGRAR